MKIYKIKKSNIDNRGVYAAKNIKAGKIIIYYKGKIITKKETDTNKILSGTEMKSKVSVADWNGIRKRLIVDLH